MVAHRDAQRMTVDEWRESERNSHEIKHEYIDGRAYAMTGGTLAHGRIGSNAVRALEDALEKVGKLCYVYNSDVAVRLSVMRYTYPDATVTCDEHDRATPGKSEVEAPRLIIEVLSDSTEAYDRGRKFSFYRACPTIEEYVLVSTNEQAVEVYRRTGTGWAIYQSYGPGEQIALISLGIHIPVATLYRNSGVPETIDDTEGEV